MRNQPLSLSQSRRSLRSRLALLGATLLASLAAAVAPAAAAPFTPGNVVVYRVGDGVASLVNTGSPVFLDEYTAAGTLVQSVALPTTASGAQRQLIASGTSASEGLLTRSDDGQYLVLAGYATNIGGGSSLSSTTASTIPRSVGRVDAFAAIDTSTALTDFASSSSPRSVASVDGSKFWVAGGAGGVRHVLSVGDTTSNDLGSSTLGNVRALGVFAGQLYVSSGSGTNTFRGVDKVGTLLPTSGAQSYTRLPGLTDSSNPSTYGFILADLDGSVAGVDTLYFTDDGAGALSKFSLVGGTWVSNGTIGVDADDYRGLTATVSGSTVTLYATRKGGSGATGGGELVSLVDSSGYNGAFSGSPTVVVALPAGSNKAFRGVALAPVSLSANTATPTPSWTPGGPTSTSTPTHTPSSPTTTPTITQTPTPTVVSTAFAGQITNPGQLIPGTSAQAVVGDYILENGLIRVILDDLANPHGFADTGGNIIDAATVGGEDRFASLFTYFNNSFGQQALYDTITVLDAGGGGSTSHIRTSGVHSAYPSINVVTDYTLGPADRYVKIVTQFTNNSAVPAQQIQVGDAVQWGLTTHFAPGWNNNNRNIPGDGHDIGGVSSLTPIWIGGDGQGSSYGYTVPTSTVELINGSSWSDANVAYLDIPVGGSASYTRFFIVGSGSLASVSNTVFDIRGAAVGTLAGNVSETGTGVPIPEATVSITKTQCLGVSGAVSYTIATTDAAGHYNAQLEPGTYKVLIEAVGRGSASCQTVTITNGGNTTLNGTLAGKGTLAWNVLDENAQPLPVKVSVLYSPVGTNYEGPELGDWHTLVGGYAVLSSTGTGSTTVPPGNYQVWISRGIEYDVSVHNVTLTAGSTTNINATLHRVVDTTGYLSADMHVHALNSADSGISFEIRAQQAAAEGLEVAIPTDHDWYSDMAAAIASTGVAPWVTTFPGDEITTNEWGHFGGYPVTLVPTADRNGALSHRNLTPTQIFANLRADSRGPLVQINHPRAGGIGYFDLVSLNPLSGESPDPNYSLGYDVLEVFNGKRLYQIPTVQRDWYHLLNNGKRVTGAGNTDTHVVFSQELGYPRNFLAVGTDTPAALTESAFKSALTGQKSMFTNGPFVELTVNGNALGSQFTDSSGTVTAHVRIQAPTWIVVDTLNIVVNGEVVQTIAVPNGGGVERLNADYELIIAKDSWIAVEVKGGDCSTDSSNNCLTTGCPGRMDPVIPPQYGTDPVCPYAHTNPVYVDFDGNGQFAAPGNPGLNVEPIAAVRPVDSNAVNTRLNETVTVRGVVTVPSYGLDHRSNLIYFQDNSIDTGNTLSGGMTIYQGGLINPILDLGDEIQVTGTITQFSGLTELVGVSIAVLQKGAAVPDPTVVTVALLRNVANAEQWEGMLVRINGVTIVSGTWPAFGDDANITVKDSSTASTITMRVDGDTDIDGTTLPTTPFDLIAVVGQFDFSAPYNGFYQLLPRQRADIIEAANASQLTHRPAATEVTSCSAEISWYTSKAATSRVDFGTTASYGSMVTNATSSSSHVVALSGLLPNTTYHYQATAGTVVSTDATFTTAAGVNPVILSGPEVSLVDESTVQIRWETDLPTTAAVEYGYTASYGGSVSGTAGQTLHAVTLTGLTPNSTYHFRVTDASSACGSGSHSSNDATFQTATAPGCPAINTMPLAAAYLNVAYDQTMQASNGSGPYTFVLADGTLPSGLGLSAAGQITGTPTTAGPFAFAITVQDSHSCVATLVYSMTIAAAPPSCPLTPQSGCLNAVKSAFKIKNTGDVSKSQVAFSWTKGTALAADFGDPVTGSTGYALCVYKDNALIMEPVVAADGNWKQTSKGFSYKLKGGNASGVATMKLGSGVGSAKVQIKGKGANLTVPAIPLSPSGNVTVQVLKNPGNGAQCWQSVFTQFKRDEAPTFQSKLP